MATAVAERNVFGPPAAARARFCRAVGTLPTRSA
jgi:hypothetical protein